jgi:hypothetical protein
MDPYWEEHLQDNPSKVDWEIVRKNLGYTLSHSPKMDLALMTPKNELSSTTYCLADTGNAYLIFLPAAHQRNLCWFYWLGLNQWIGVITKLCGGTKQTLSIFQHHPRRLGCSGSAPEPVEPLMAR